MDPNEVDRVAALARLYLSPAERTELIQKFETVFGYFKDLQNCDTSSVHDPLYHFAQSLATREDKVATSLDRESVLSNAPEVMGHYIKISKVVETGE